MPKRPVPDIPRTKEHARYVFDSAIKENIEVLTGVRSGIINLLESNASNTEIIDKVNEIINRLQR